MAIEVTCGGCGERLSVEDERTRLEAKCPACGYPLRPAGSRTEVELFIRSGIWRKTSLQGPPRRRRRTVWPWVVAGGAVALALATVLVLVGLGRDGTPPESAAPRPTTVAGPPADRVTGAPPSAPVSHTAASPRGRQRRPTAERFPARRQPVAEKGPAAAPPAPVPARVAPAGFESGPLEPGLTDNVRSIVVMHMRKTIRAGRLGVAVARPGTKVDVTFEGRRYLAVVHRRFSASALKPGELSLERFYLRTTGPWKLSEDVTIPSGSYIAYEDGTCEVLDRSALQARARARGTVISEAVAQIDKALSERDWQRAKEVLAAARAQYPHAIELAQQATKIERRSDFATITVINGGGRDLGFQLVRDGHTVKRIVVKSGEPVELELRKGDYQGTWRGQDGPTAEELTVSRSETWAFRVGTRFRGRNMPPLKVWRREVVRRDRGYAPGPRSPQ